MPREELRNYYRDFGFGNAISERRSLLSYVAWISDKIRLLAINCDGDCGKFKGLWDDPKNKKLKIPVTILGRLFFFKVDKSISKLLLKNVAVELIRNVFVSNEPYVKGTPLYEAIMKLLKQLNPVISVLEKKLGVKNKMFADIPAFVASLTGDEKQLDYTATVKINYKG